MSIFLFIFFDFHKGFYSEENFWTITTTVPVIVYTWSGAHFVCYQILSMSIIIIIIFFDFLKGFYWKKFFGQS